MKEKIILPSRNMVKEDATAKKFYVIPWILSIIFLTWILVYQSIYTYVKIIWHNSDKVLEVILWFLETKIWKETLILILIFLVIYFLLVPIFEAWLIKYIDVKYKNPENKLSKSEAFWQWLTKFLQIFEYNNIFSEFKILSILNWYLFVLRFTWVQYVKIITYIFLFLFVFWLIINILFVYSKYFLVIENKTVFESISASTRLTILNPKNTIQLFFLMFILNFRVIINFLIFLIFPVLIVLTITYISIKILLFLALFLLVIIFVFLIFFMWYITAVLDIFKVALWYHAYIYSKKTLEK